MQKKNLPVIILKGIVLLPHNDIRLEIDDEVSKNILNTAEYFHNNQVLIVSQTDTLEETTIIDSLPRIGVISKITHKMDLPNGKKRIIISGLKRALVDEYLNTNNLEQIESIVSEIKEIKIDEQEEKTLLSKLYKELEKYVKDVPYISNSVLSIIKSVTTLAEATDIVVPYLIIELDRFKQYLEKINSKDRIYMLLEDIYKEKERFEIEKHLDQKVKQEIDNNQREYFLREKLNTIKKELNETSSKESEVSLLKTKLKNLELPDNIKDKVKAEIDRYDNLPSLSPEISMIRGYVDWLLDIPWNKYTEDNHNLKEAKEKLDETHYGLEEIKTRIIEYLAVKEKTNSLKSPILCFVGPPGVGKTSLAISIANAINRNFVKMSVGGVHDEAEIKGHRRAYLGANPGRIVRGLKKAKSINPVFLIDEIDKMTKDIKGDPASALLEVLDPEQNKYFSDHYIEEEIDLSNVMFIATANNIENIPSALKDRLEIINISGYTEYEKLDIAKNYLLKKISKEHGINTVNVSEEAILKIINQYTKESGVRELERKIAQIIRKQVTKNVIEKENIKKVTLKNIEEYLGYPVYLNNEIKNNEPGTVNGLSYTPYGGAVQKIEVTFYKGNGKILLTGSLGDVMKESAQIAFSYVKANYKEFNLELDELLNSDIHINAPEGAVKKDGPSAGVALTTAIIGAFSKKQIDSKTAMTGEITLKGNVLPIGGLKEKTIGAKRNGINKILIPKDNYHEIDKLPVEIKTGIEFITVSNYKEIYDEVFV